MNFNPIFFLFLSVILMAIAELAHGQRGGYNRRRSQQQQEGGIRFPDESSRNSGEGNRRGEGNRWGEGNRGGEGNRRGGAGQGLHQGKFPGGFYGGTKW